MTANQDLIARSSSRNVNFKQLITSTLISTRKIIFMRPWHSLPPQIKDDLAWDNPFFYFAKAPLPLFLCIKPFHFVQLLRAPSTCCPIHKSSNKVNWVFKCTHLNSVGCFFFLTHSYTHVLVYTYTRVCLWGHGICLASVFTRESQTIFQSILFQIKQPSAHMTISTEK